ncbi:TonB-dependent receptor plug domain-containing protein [Pseudomonas aeruginosa]|nr:TonB-dependent receptor plug domain-containing protein [Pseudomonas aeruginosa]
MHFAALPGDHRCPHAPFPPFPSCCCPVACSPTPYTPPARATAPAIELGEQTVVATAQEETKQAPGVSIITAEDIAKRPPSNDLSQIIRTMPGVNLTGNSSSGQRGNNRQIDIRGMGPENTLILVDGKPVSSRNSVRYGWRGERDSRGDTNWVPADQVERIEVIRGPAAARYGNGAAGGVVNIITKQAGAETHGNLSVYSNFPQHKAEGASERMSFGLNGPLTENLSYRVYGNIAKTDSDDWDINAGHESNRTGAGPAPPAGREGVRNKRHRRAAQLAPDARADPRVRGRLQPPGQHLHRRHAEHQQQQLREADARPRDQPHVPRDLLGHPSRRMGLRQLAGLPAVREDPQQPDQRWPGRRHRRYLRPQQRRLLHRHPARPDRPRRGQPAAAPGLRADPDPRQRVDRAEARRPQLQHPEHRGRRLDPRSRRKEPQQQFLSADLLAVRRGQHRA